MPEAPSIIGLRGALRDLVAWLQAAHIRGIVIGGVAASLLGRPRVTRDIDALVLLDERHWEKFLGAGRRFGFVPRRSDPIAFAKKTRVLLVHHEPSGVDVDVVLGSLGFEEEAVKRAVGVEVGGVRIPLPKPEDLIIMKAVACRPRDVADIESVLDTHPKLNVRRIRRWVREFSRALEMPEISKNLETLLTRRRKRKR